MAEFKNEYEYLIHLVKCAMRDLQPEEMPENFSFKKVFEFGKAHEVSNIAYIAVQKLQNKPDADTLKDWKTFYAFSITRNANQFEVRSNIIDIFAQNNIRSLEVQGTIMKTFYPRPEWRMMTDIDFIVDKKNLPKIKALFESKQYNPTYSVGDDLEPFEVGSYADYNTLIEVHSEFFEHSEYEAYGSITEPFANAVPTGEKLCYKTDDTTFYLYTILHCIKHYLGKGCGIRRILDIFVLNEKLGDKIDKDRVNEVFERSGYTKTVQELFALSEKWFGDSAADFDLSHAEEIVIKSGNHGSDVIKYSRRLEKSGQNVASFRLKSLLSRIFLSKKEIYSTYPYCKEHNLPLVFAWIYRWGCLLFVKKYRNKAKRTITIINNTKLK